MQTNLSQVKGTSGTVIILNYHKSSLNFSWLSIITGLDYWTVLLDWTTGLTFFVLKAIFMAYNEISCQYMHYIGF